MFISIMSLLWLQSVIVIILTWHTILTVQRHYIIDRSLNRSRVIDLEADFDLIYNTYNVSSLNITDTSRPNYWIHTHLPRHNGIYIYIFVCVCVCVCLCIFNVTLFFQSLCALVYNLCSHSNIPIHMLFPVLGLLRLSYVTHIWLKYNLCNSEGYMLPQ